MDAVPLPAVPGADDFRALARSSPWRFITVHFAHQRHCGAAPGAGGIVEAWLDRRTHRVTVRSRRGVDVEHGPPYGGSTQQRRDEPTLRPDGLVASRANDWHFGNGDPMWRDYQWTAMLDPAELSYGVEIDDIAATTVRGRPTWSATCRPLLGDGADWDGGYEPRCGCCPLLDSTASRIREYGPDDPERHGTDVPTTYRVRLDVQTSIVVQIDALYGRAGLVLSNAIYAVDRPLNPPSS